VNHDDTKISKVTKFVLVFVVFAIVVSAWLPTP